MCAEDDGGALLGGGLAGCFLFFCLLLGIQGGLDGRGGETYDCETEKTALDTAFEGGIVMGFLFFLGEDLHVCYCLFCTRIGVIV